MPLKVPATPDSVIVSVSFGLPELMSPIVTPVNGLTVDPDLIVACEPVIVVTAGTLSVTEAEVFVTCVAVVTPEISNIEPEPPGVFGP